MNIQEFRFRGHAFPAAIQHKQYANDCRDQQLFHRLDKYTFYFCACTILKTSSSTSAVSYLTSTSKKQTTHFIHLDWKISDSILTSFILPIFSFSMKQDRSMISNSS